jgi:hypothetical protein
VSVGTRWDVTAAKVRPPAAADTSATNATGPTRTATGPPAAAPTTPALAGRCAPHFHGARSAAGRQRSRWSWASTCQDEVTAVGDHVLTTGIGR